MEPQTTHPVDDHDAQKTQILSAILKNRALAHKILFPHRHKNTPPEFHEPLLDLLYSEHRWVALEAFRGAAKSTLMEEVVIIKALFREFRFPIILGNSYDRACERLSAIKREFETNDNIAELFGEQVGGTWAQDQIVLTNGTKIQCFGARQSLRGAKHNDQRPDFALVDDLEDEDNVATEDARRKLKRWFNGALIPALDPESPIRVVGTPLHPKSLLEEKMCDPAWVSRRFPILNFNAETGVEESAWPDRFRLEYINELKQNYIRDGNYVEFEQEYMCRSEDIANKPFQPGMFKVEPVISQWMPVEIMVDPARTTNVKSARTGYAAWSWVGTKLIVHEAFGAYHKPDEIIAEMFRLNDKYQPVSLGVELDGLEEFIMQPLRSEMLKRGVTLPLAPQHAPRDKLGFITSLQPFYKAGEVIHAGHFPDLVGELLQFPSGLKDVPNALAYALKMRGGRPVYSDFTLGHVIPELAPNMRKPLHLVFSSRPSVTAAVLLQFNDGVLKVLGDWVMQGPPSDMVQTICQEAILLGGQKAKTYAPADQFDRYTNIGLPQAIKKMGTTPQQLGTTLKAQGFLADWMRKTVNGAPVIQVSDGAVWTRNGLARGYIRKLKTDGTLGEQPEENYYRLVIEAIETFAQWVNSGVAENNNSSFERHYARTDDGRQYLTTLPR